MGQEVGNKAQRAQQGSQWDSAGLSEAKMWVSLAQWVLSGISGDNKRVSGGQLVSARLSRVQQGQEVGQRGDQQGYKWGHK